MKRITKKAWFGKKKIGWGLSPSSIEGWLTTVVFLIVVFVIMQIVEPIAMSTAITTAQ